MGFGFKSVAQAFNPAGFVPGVPQALQKVLPRPKNQTAPMPTMAPASNPYGLTDTTTAPSPSEPIPKYNPYTNPDGSLKSMATYTPQKQGYQDLSGVFGQQRDDLTNSMNTGFNSNMNSMLSQGGLDSGARERLTMNSGVDRAKALSGLGAQQSLQQGQSNYNVDQFNTGAANDASQFNIGTMLGENRFGSAADLDRFKTEMSVKGAQANADALTRYGNSAPKNPWDTNMDHLKGYFGGMNQGLGSPFGNVMKNLYF